MAAALLVAGALLLWEGRGQTFFVDEWSFGYLARQSWALPALLSPDNGHLAVLPVVITKASLALFGAATALPVRLVATATHLATAAMLFLFLRRALGAVWALLPAVLFLFLGAAADVLVGSHALPIELSAATGLGAWLALRRRDTLGDVLAAALLTAGIASNGFALPFVAGAAAIVALEEPRPGWRRQWVVALPLVLYAIWRLTEGSGQEGDFAFSNIGGLPAFAFDSLAAEIAAVTGLFTEPGGTANAYQLGPGQALAGASLLGLGALAVGRGYRPPRAAIPALLALLALWLATGMVASPARQPQVGRYVYCGVLLLLILLAEGLAASPYARRGALALTCVCAVGLIPNLKGIDDGGTFFRQQSNQNRAVLGAADLLPPGSGETALLEEAQQPSGGYADMGYPVSVYRTGERAYGSPGLSLEELRSAEPAAREDADIFLSHALPLQLTPAAARPPAETAAIRLTQEGGRLVLRHGCGEFRPTELGAQMSFALPPGGVWLRPAPGSPLTVGLRRFADGFAVQLEALPGRAAELRLPAGPAAREWQAQLLPNQPLLICGLPAADTVAP